MKIALLVVLVLAGPARADDEIAAGSVVKIEAQEIYVSLGTERGVAAGAPLRIKRTISLRNPVSGAQVTDWIPIGSAKVTQAGGVLSRAVVGQLVAEIKVGDIVEVFIDRPDRAPRAQSNQPPTDPVIAEVLGLFASQTGQSIDARIAGWERYLSTHAGSPYADGVRRDLDALHGLRDQMKPPSSTENAETITTVEHSPPSAAHAGAPLALTFVAAEPQRIASAFLHYRVAGAPTYHRVLLSREHDIYLRGAIPPQAVQPPGLEYFVEVANPAGRSGLALASPEQPIAVAVAGPPLIDQFGSAPGRSSVKLAFDYLDFATFDTRMGNHKDTLVSATIDCTYRMQHGSIESFGVGYGVYAGTGGFANEVWMPGHTAPRTGFDYGYAAIDVGGYHSDPGVRVSGGGQLIAGVGKQGFGIGVEAHGRIGDRLGTNLTLSGRSIEQVGLLSELRFGVHPIAPFLLGVSVGATTQPNDGDVGVKLGADVELVQFRNMAISARGSWQGRSIDHGGVGAGAGVGFSW